MTLPESTWISDTPAPGVMAPGVNILGAQANTKNIANTKETVENTREAVANRLTVFFFFIFFLLLDGLASAAAAGIAAAQAEGGAE